MKSWDEKIYEAVALKRSAFFKPIAKILGAVGLKPDAISFLGLGVSALFIYEIGHNITFAFWLMVIMLLADQLDGALARYQKTDGDRGKFVDVIVDTTTFALIVVGLTHAGYIGAATAGLYIYFATLSRALMIIRKNAGRSSSWLFYAGAGPLPSTFIYATYLLFGLAVFTQTDWLQGSSIIFAAILALKSAADFVAIRYKN